MPKIFRLKKGGKLNRAIFNGSTINTPSMLCVEDYLDALKWTEEIGLDGLMEKSRTNLHVVENWVGRTDWIDFLAESAEIRSNTSVCLKITNDKFRTMPEKDKTAFIKDIADTLSKKNIAHDMGSYKNAPPGFRLWCGPTVEASDVKLAIDGLEKVCLEKLSKL
jgi:phosphoserine aminotransferase